METVCSELVCSLPCINKRVQEKLLQPSAAKHVCCHAACVCVCTWKSAFASTQGCNPACVCVCYLEVSLPSIELPDLSLTQIQACPRML